MRRGGAAWRQVSEDRATLKRGTAMASAGQRLPQAGSASGARAGKLADPPVQCTTHQRGRDMTCI